MCRPSFAASVCEVWPVRCCALWLLYRWDTYLAERNFADSLHKSRVRVCAVRIQVDAAEAVTGAPIARQVRAYWAGTMISAALNILLILAIGSGIGESRDRRPVDNYPGVHENGGKAGRNAPIDTA